MAAKKLKVNGEIQNTELGQKTNFGIKISFGNANELHLILGSLHRYQIKNIFLSILFAY